MNNTTKSQNPCIQHTIEAHSRLERSRNIGDFKVNLHKIINELGFSDFIFIRLDRQWIRGNHHGLLHSVPPELFRVYQDEKMFQYDLFITSTTRDGSPQFSSTIFQYLNEAPYEIELITKNRKIQQLHRRFGFFDHYITPMPAYNGSDNVLFIITDKYMHPDRFQTLVCHREQQLHTLCKTIDTVSTQQFKKTFVENRNTPAKISARQLEIFKMIANDDISIVKAADRLNISPITAHQHISAARRTLGVSTNIAAIRKLVMYGYIHY